MTLALLITAVGGAWGNAADHNYGNRHRASQLQHGEYGNRFIQYYCTRELTIPR